MPTVQLDSPGVPGPEGGIQAPEEVRPLPDAGEGCRLLCRQGGDPVVQRRVRRRSAGIGVPQGLRELPDPAAEVRVHPDRFLPDRTGLLRSRVDPVKDDDVDPEHVQKVLRTKADSKSVLKSNQVLPAFLVSQ